MYEAFYGLKGQPFQLTPNPNFYFESQTHRKALSYLGYGLAQGEGFIVITGEIGSGKTTLVAHLMARVDRARLTAAQIVTSQLDSGALIAMVARAFGIDPEPRDKAGLLGAIEKFLLGEAREGRRCLLVVDEAQGLSVDALEELRMLSNFQLGSQALLQIFLLGQPEFRDKLLGAPSLEQLRQRIIATHHLDAMNANEIQAYIEHRLGKVGWTGRPAFDPAVFPMLHAESGGVPRKLNMLLNRTLLMGAIERAETIDPAVIRAVLADIDEHDAAPRAKAPERAPEPAPAPAPVASAPAPAPAPAPAAQPDVETLERLAALEARVAAAEQPAGRYVDAEELRIAIDRITALEARLAGQEIAIRRTLAMLIDWVENDDAGLPPARAAG